LLLVVQLLLVIVVFLVHVVVVLLAQLELVLAVQGLGVPLVDADECVVFVDFVVDEASAGIGRTGGC